jgi:hypothetical protein
MIALGNVAGRIWEKREGGREGGKRWREGGKEGCREGRR